MRKQLTRIIAFSVITLSITACGDTTSGTPETTESSEETATPTVSISSPADGATINAMGDTASIDLTYAVADGRDDDAVDCMVDETSRGLGNDGVCSFESISLGEHTLSVAVLHSNGEAYANVEASASVSITVASASCSSISECDDGDPCTLEACDGGACAYYASPIAGCDSGLEDFICKADDDCAGFIEGMGSCATAACEGDNKVCVVTILEEGADCDDGDTCTMGDVCTGGDCVADGPADCNDDNPCTEETCDGAAGGCLYTDVVCDDEDACTIDTCGAEGCVFEASTGDCDDGDFCTAEDLCTDGVCAGVALDCEDGDFCTAEICDAETGDCIVDESVPSLDCDDGEVCTTDICLEDASCSNEPTINTPCDDGDLCTVDDICTGGACAPGTPKSCNNGDDCDGIETCDVANGECAGGIAVICDDGDACTTDACDSGFCVVTPIPNCCVASSDCDNNDPCDGVEFCEAGFCAIGTAPSCGDGNTDEVCGEACDDGNTDGGDGCSATCGIEVPECTTIQDCNDANPCTDDECVANVCIYNNNTIACDDADECTVADGCVAGLCVGDPKFCDDGFDCTADSCDSAIGCVTAEDDSLCAGVECKIVTCDATLGCVQEADLSNGADCEGDACTENGTCQFGVCVGDTATCDDGETCTGPDCHPVLGCTYPAETNKVCDDGDSCTESDICGVTDGGASICQGTAIEGCGEEGLICSLTGAEGDTVSCFLSIAASNGSEVQAMGLQFNMVYDGSKVTLINFYDEFCFMGVCQDAHLTGPGSQTLSTGHSLAAAPSVAVDWDGSGFAAFSNFSNSTATFTEAYLDADGTTIIGDSEFVEARFTLVSAVTGADPAEIVLESVEAFHIDGQDMEESFVGSTIVTTPSP